MRGEGNIPPERPAARRLFAVVLAVCFVAAGCGMVEVVPAKPSETKSGPPEKVEISRILIDLLERQDKTAITANDYDSTSLRQIITLGTPAGHRIKLRYLNFGISLVEALKVSRDSELRRRMIEVVQWSRSPRVRGEALLTLAALYDPTHKRYFKEALLDSNVAIRFAAVEALQQWEQPEATPLIRMSMDRDWSPLMRVFAAQALLSLGDASAEAILWQGLDNSSWLIRAMSARYLGDYAKPADYSKLLSYMNRETRSDFVTAELAIATLKLISRKGDKVSYSPASKGWRDNAEVRYTLGRDQVIEIEPLIIVAPQLRIPASLQAAAQINTRLLQLIENRLDVPLDPLQSQDPVLQDLNVLETPTGFALKTRYTELSYLVTEGLAGTQDRILRSHLQRLAGEARNPLVKASALISLSYSRDEADLYLMQTALNDKSPIVRFGAMEAVQIGGFRAAMPSIMVIAGTDPSPALQVYAMQVLSRFGDSAGHNLLFSRLNDPDWPARAMSYWYLGLFGNEDDYSTVMARLPTETNPFVQAEMILAALRLSPVPAQ